MLLSFRQDLLRKRIENDLFFFIYFRTAAGASHDFALNLKVTSSALRNSLNRNNVGQAWRLLKLNRRILHEARRTAADRPPRHHPL